MKYAARQSFHLQELHDDLHYRFLPYPKPGHWENSIERKHFVYRRRSMEYTFYPHFHPYVGDLVQKLARGLVPGLQAADTARKPGVPLDSPNSPVLYAEFFNTYDPAAAADADAPQTGVYVNSPRPVHQLDFSSAGAYSVYNWELFYHIPLLVALHLHKNQRFPEAQRWLQFIFDPADDSDLPAPMRFWKVLPFQRDDVKLVEEILVNLSTRQDDVLFRETLDGIGAWKDTPFRPHAVARYRPTAYMFKAVFAWLDNLLAWGDSLFRQDSGEAIDEALQLYVTAANILGPRPHAVPKKGSVRPQTYNNLRKDLDAMGNALVSLESDILFDLAPLPNADDSTGRPSDARRVTLNGLGRTLYFCVPRNEKLLSYWDAVADRLYKIHNSLNLAGVFRQLPLFEPPIDPALLAKAAAAGLDAGAVVAGLNQPLPLVRFALLFGKAQELCGEVKSLGAALLGAIEKEDNETLSLLRSRHEQQSLGLAEALRYAQWQEAQKNREGTEKSLANAIARYTWYERQLGRRDNEITIPGMDGLNVADLLTNLRFSSTEPVVGPRDIPVDIASGLGDPAAGKKLNSHEVTEGNLLEGGQIAQDVAAGIEAIGAFLNLIPMISADGKPLGVGAGVQFGGMNISAMMSGVAAISKAVGGRLSFEASKAAKTGGYARREQDWAFQSNSAGGEINQVFKQLRAAQIREHIAEREWRNHQQQMRNAEELRHFLEGEKLDGGERKFSTRDFYVWQRREVKNLYGHFYRFALESAKKAERALQHELGDPMLSFIQPNYQSGHEGLLAGEKLALDLKRMEMTWHDLNRREYEMTKHVSMLQVSPEALVALRATGRCTFTVPEEAFDLDTPGHYFRRIKSVGLSIPCVAGPYTGVHCTLTLTKSSIRTKTALSDGYGRAGLEDERFSNNFSSVQSVVTSTAQNDSGLFETNLRDERFLPFEGSGAVSEWQLEMPAEFRQFDYGTISDVILHIRYTAREGGGLLKNGAVENLRNLLAEAGDVRLFSMRHEFSEAWHRFQNPPAGEVPKLAFELTEEHFPFWAKGRLGAVKKARIFGTGLDEEVAGLADAPPLGLLEITPGVRPTDDVFLLLTWTT